MLNLFNRSRRNFIKNTAIGTVATLSIPQIVSAAMLPEKVKKIALKKGDTILLQGDSITDWHRSRTEITGYTVGALGSGYSFFTTGELLKQYPAYNLNIFNRGVSGDKVFQLADRWDKDCLELKPNVLSVLIGVNDFWAITKHGYTGTIETYRTDYKKLLDRTMQALPDVKLIIGEPFAVKDVKEVNDSWYPKFNEYRDVARETAKAFNATFISYQSIFDEAIKQAPGSYWTIDGVHPSTAGACLMAHAWMETVKG
jgi:lysophospholipase L1-like esterase